MLLTLITYIDCRKYKCQPLSRTADDQFYTQELSHWSLTKFIDCFWGWEEWFPEKVPEFSYVYRLNLQLMNLADDINLP